MPLRPGMEADDIVTPKRAAEILDVPVGTVSSWISRYRIEPVGMIGRWPVYDFRDIAEKDPGRRRRAESEAA